MIVVKQKGSFKETKNFLKRNRREPILQILNKYGKKGVSALASATPIDSGLTASSWSYEITMTEGSYTINWTNSNVNDGVPIAIILQYGHGTNHGGYVQGRDYINPALKPIFDEIANSVWEEVSRS